MIKSAESEIKDYLKANPTATKEEIVSKVFYGYLGNGKARKALEKILQSNN